WFSNYFNGNIICSPTESIESWFVGFDALRRTVNSALFYGVSQASRPTRTIKTGIKNQRRRPSTIQYYLLSLI
ncbi:MAG: hypothetical protein IK955_04190, partial [Clostridia bacterium]|nr:hypothetical protein [Clostridia bacterium]